MSGSPIPDYIAAFKAVNGYEPIAEQEGRYWNVATKSGNALFSAKDIRNVTRGLKALAQEGQR